MNPREETKKRFSVASEEIKQMICSFDTFDQLEIIAKNNKLNQDQTNKLGQVFTSVLLGLTPLDSFQNKLVAYLGVQTDAAQKIITEVNAKLVSKVQAQIQKSETIAKIDNDTLGNETLNKNDVLDEIENPVPAKPIVINPAGKNPILDAQHNLPEGEKKVLISSSAVPSRGPILNNFRNSFVATPTTPTTPVVPPAPVVPKPVPPTIPTPPKPIQVTTPPAPTKYKVDPYREPIE